MRFERRHLPRHHRRATPSWRAAEKCRVRPRGKTLCAVGRSIVYLWQQTTVLCAIFRQIGGLSHIASSRPMVRCPHPLPILLRSPRRTDFALNPARGRRAGDDGSPAAATARGSSSSVPAGRQWRRPSVRRRRNRTVPYFKRFPRRPLRHIDYPAAGDGLAARIASPLSAAGMLVSRDRRPARPRSRRPGFRCG